MSGVVGRSGRRGKTAKQHKLDGTHRKDRHSGYTNADPPLGDPPKPDGLGAVASAEWDRMVERLRQAKTLAVTDDAALEDYVQQHATVQRLQALQDSLAQDELAYVKITTVVMADAHPHEVGEPKMHPVVGQLRQARLTRSRFLVELGQTPASRSRVKVPEQPAEDDPFARFAGLRVVN